MAITYGTPTSGAGAGSDTLTINKPTGVVNTDILIAFLHTDFRTVSAVPSGWDLIESEAAIARPKNYCYAKSITDAGSEPASYSWTLSGTDDTVGVIVAVSGGIYNATNAFEKAKSNTAATAGTSISSPAVTPSDADSLVLRMCCCNEAITGPGGEDTEIVNVAGTEDMAVTAFTHAASDTGTATFTLAASDQAGCITIAIAPAATTSAGGLMLTSDHFNGGVAL